MPLPKTKSPRVLVRYRRKTNGKKAATPRRMPRAKHSIPIDACTWSAVN